MSERRTRGNTKMSHRREGAVYDACAMSSSGDDCAVKPAFPATVCQPRNGGCCTSLRAQPEVSCTSSDVSCCSPSKRLCCPPQQPRCCSRQNSGITSDTYPFPPLPTSLSAPSPLSSSWLSLAQPSGDAIILPLVASEEAPARPPAVPSVSSLLLFNRHISLHSPPADLVRLPETCLRIICSNLSARSDIASIAATCRRLLTISSQTLTHLHLSTCPEHSVFVRLFQRFPALISLNLTANNSHSLLSDWHVTLIASRKLPLLSLSLEKQSLLTDVALAQLAIAHPSLHTLNLNSCVALSDRALTAIAEGCQDLQQFRMCYCRKVTLQGLGQLSTRCPNLQLLELSDMNGLAGQWNSLKNLLISCDACECPVTLSSIQTTCPTLTSLVLRFCCRPSGQLDAIRRTSTCLASLQLESCTDIPPDLFRLGWPYLTSLHLSSSVVTSEVLAAVGEGCPNLTDITLHACTGLSDIAILQLVQSCKFLQVLDVKQCPRVTHSLLVSLAVRKDIGLRRIVLPRQCFGAKHLKVISRHQWELDTSSPSWQLVQRQEVVG